MTKLVCDLCGYEIERFFHAEVKITSREGRGESESNHDFCSYQCLKLYSLRQVKEKRDLLRRA